MGVQKNIQFTVLVKIEGRIREFNFRKRSDTLYDGDTSDEQNSRWVFKWTHNSDGWHVDPNTPSLPSWLANNNAAIREAFLTEML